MIVELARIAIPPTTCSIAADLVPKLEQEPTVVLPGGAALPLKVALASNQPAWVHERYLPLWLIKAYEEKVCRERSSSKASSAACLAQAGRSLKLCLEHAW